MEIVFQAFTPDTYGLAKQFKRATTADINGDDHLFDVWFPAERSYEAALARMQAFDKDSCVFLEVDGEIAGSLELRMLHDGRGYLNNIYLKPEWRGQRLGDAMDTYAMSFFKKHHADAAALETNALQPKVIAFYQRLGWVYEGDGEQGMIWMGKNVE